jgi:succinate-acetate transporter protein
MATTSAAPTTGMHEKPLAPGVPADGYGPLTDDPVSYQRYFTRIANPGPVGMYAFSYTVFLWSFYLVHTRGIHSPNLLAAVGLFVGGLVQFLAGMWEFPRGNVFGATIYTMLAGFFFSYAIILLPVADVASSVPGGQLGNALGLFYIVWFIISILWLFAVARRNISFILLFGFWSLTLLLLAISNWTTKSANRTGIAGGSFGFVTALIGLYIATAELFASEMAWGFSIPLGHMGGRNVARRPAV